MYILQCNNHCSKNHKSSTQIVNKVISVFIKLILLSLLNTFWKAKVGFDSKESAN